MELFELRYFLGVARFENIHKASESLRVSPGSLSKAVSRLEGELGVRLFSREGRNIRLTEQGRLLQRRASEIVQIEESARAEIAGSSALHAVLAGPETLLARQGLELCETIRKRHPGAVFDLRACGDEAALEQVARGEAHLALVTAAVPQRLVSRVTGEAVFQTCVGPGHPLHAAAKARKSVPVEEVLRHPFVSPSSLLLGKVGLEQSPDGWRDDQFPRKVGYVASSIKVLEAFVLQGLALAYLPDYWIRDLGVPVLKITGCPYSCRQTIRLVARNPRSVGWLNQLF